MPSQGIPLFRLLRDLRASGISNALIDSICDQYNCDEITYEQLIINLETLHMPAIENRSYSLLISRARQRGLSAEQQVAWEFDYNANRISLSQLMDLVENYQPVPDEALAAILAATVEIVNVDATKTRITRGPLSFTVSDTPHYPWLNTRSKGMAARLVPLLLERIPEYPNIKALCGVLVGTLGQDRNTMARRNYELWNQNKIRELRVPSGTRAEYTEITEQYSALYNATYWALSMISWNVARGDTSSADFVELISFERKALQSIRGLTRAGTSCPQCGRDDNRCTCPQCTTATCNTRLLLHETIYIPGRGEVCLRCAGDDYVHSSCQNRWLSRADAVQNQDSGDWAYNNYARENWLRHADGTWHTNRAVLGSLMNYSTNPFSFYTWDKRNKENALVFGVELEVEPRSDREHTQRSILSALTAIPGGIDKFIMKNDGSLDNGVEIVTMPFTLKQHLDGTGPNWAGITEALKGIARSGLGTDRCGIHIHINRKALSALTIGKMLVFLNNEDLAPLMSLIAQRPASSYCRRGKKKIANGKDRSSDRYDMMNIGDSKPTCEVRMFKGNLRLERIYKNIEFVHATVQYCRQASMNDLGDWGNFSRWMIENRGAYPHLFKFLVDKNAAGFKQLKRKSNEHYKVKVLADV